LLGSLSAAIRRGLIEALVITAPLVIWMGRYPRRFAAALLKLDQADFLGHQRLVIRGDSPRPY